MVTSKPQVVTQTVENIVNGEEKANPKQTLLKSNFRKMYHPSTMSVYFSKDGKLCHSNSKYNSPFTSNTGYDPKGIKRKQVYWRMTRVLLLISMSFLVLNFPVFFLQLCHFSRSDNINNRDEAIHDQQLSVAKSESQKGVIMNDELVHATHKNMTAYFQESHIHSSLLVELFERFAYYIYYLHFTINFIIFDRLSIFKKNS